VAAWLELSNRDRQSSPNSPARSCLNHVAHFVENPNHSVMRVAAKRKEADCIWLAIPLATEWQRMGNQIGGVLI
jgi:hypothetical protein